MATFFILYKKGFLNWLPLSIRSCSYVKGRRTLNADYSFLKGRDDYTFRLINNKPVIFYYDIIVDKGSLNLKIRTKSGDIFEKKLTENETGSLEIIPKTRRHITILNGHDFKGRFQFEFK